MGGCMWYSMGVSGVTMVCQSTKEAAVGEVMLN